MTNETIFALSTAPGKAAIAIIRISGHKAFYVAKALSGKVPEPKKAVFCNLIYNEVLIDQAIIICFNADNSYTGEDMVELQVHGSNAVLANLFDILSF